MKILYLVHQFYPRHYTGTEKFVFQLAQHCQAAGHEVKVVTYDTTYPSAPVTATATTSSTKRSVFALFSLAKFKHTLLSTVKLGLRRIGIDPARLWRLLIQPFPNPLTVRTYLYQSVPVIAFRHQRYPVQHWSPTPARHVSEFARNLLQAERPDLIHVGHLMRVSDFLAVAAELEIPYLLTLTDFWAICPNCKLLNQRQQLCEGPRAGAECRTSCPQYPQAWLQQRLTATRQLLTQAAQVIAPSHMLAEKIEAEFGSLAPTVIPYGIDQTGFRLNTRHYPIDAPLVFCFSGSLNEAKGVRLLLKAFQALPNRHIQLRIYGSGPLEAQLRQQAQGDERIYFGGVYHADQVAEILQQVDVVVVPSTWHENLPLVMQEALACAVPVLVSAVGGMTECVTDGVNGFTFGVGDVADLQRTLQMIIDQPQQLNRIKENICHPQPGQFRVISSADGANLYLAEYQKIVSRSL